MLVGQWDCSQENVWWWWWWVVRWFLFLVLVYDSRLELQNFCVGYETRKKVEGYFIHFILYSVILCSVWSMEYGESEGIGMFWVLSFQLFLTTCFSNSNSSSKIPIPILRLFSGSGSGLSYSSFVVSVGEWASECVAWKRYETVII